MTTYIQCPEGYPTTTFRVSRAGSRWAIDSDVWWTPTSHDGWVRGDARYKTRAAAIAAARERVEEYEERGRKAELSAP